MIKIEFDNMILRDMIESDIEDYVRWFTVEREWESWDKAKKIAAEKGYRGIYTQGQDNNLGACLFYTKYGFRIGGLDTEVYKGTSQDGKADIIFYYDF